MTVYSTTSVLMIKFETSDSITNGEYDDDVKKVFPRRGFKARFTFSKDYADLSFVTGIHIKGTSNWIDFNFFFYFNIKNNH